MVDKGLKDAGFKTDLYFAGETDPVLQQRQVKRLLDDNVDFAQTIESANIINNIILILLINFLKLTIFINIPPTNKLLFNVNIL